jgi:hypothetical protein
MTLQKGCALHSTYNQHQRVWKELTHGGMKLNTSVEQVDNGCHEILWSDLSKDVMHKVLALLPIPRLIQVRSICK